MFLLQDGQGDSQLHLIDTRLQALVINEGAQKLQDAYESFYFSNLVCLTPAHDAHSFHIVQST